MSRAPTFRGLPAAARLYLPAVFGLAAGAVALASAAERPELVPALLLAAAVLCAAGNLFEVFAPASFSFQPNLAIFLWASLFLPPWAVAVLAVACFLPGLVVHRFRWYMVAFNVANYTLAAMAADAIVGLDGDLLTGTPDLGTAAALAAAALAFVAVNHTLIALVVTLARGRPLRKSAAEMLSCAPIDVALAMTGACLAALWAAAPPLALLAAGPMALMYRALWVPLLEHRSRIEPKSGLYNSEYFSHQLEDGVASARRTGRPLSLLMVDFDQLRLVNNRHGHLAGDRLIRSVSEVAAATAAASDGFAARFGGDELCLLLPGCTLTRAREVAAGLQARVAAIELEVEEAHERLAITISTGIASYPEHGETPESLLAAADAAVYDAKLGGRNRARVALPDSAREAIGAAVSLGAEPIRPASLDGVPAPALEALADRRDGGRERAGDGDPGANGTPPGEAPRAGGSAEEEEPGAPAAPPEKERGAQRSRLIAAYVGLLCGAAGLLGALSDHSALAREPWLFALLVLGVVLLDAARIDVFERANLSPAAVPELALAYFFGPVGPLAAEATIALARAVRRDPAIKWGFDFGALSLAGASAAGAFALFAPAAGVALLGAGVVAGLAYYVVNSALLALVMALAEGRGPVGVWRERLAWMTPHYLAFGLIAAAFAIAELGLGLSAVLLFALPVVMLWVAEKQYLDRSRDSVAQLRTANDELEQANARLQGLLDDNRALLGRMHRSYLSTITSLARTVEAKDPYTSGHTERVAQIAVLLAGKLGFSEQELRAVEVGSIIHDIGKIGVRDAILLKAGPLSPEEAREMRRHPEMSSYILAELELPAIVKQMVRSHHERFDGSGYPDGLRGEEIPLAARILSVADALDAMTSDRPYRSALPLAVARQEIEAMGGSQFCPRVVSAMLELIEEGGPFWAGYDEPRAGPSDEKSAPAAA